MQTNLALLSLQMVQGFRRDLPDPSLRANLMLLVGQILLVYLELH